MKRHPKDPPPARGSRPTPALSAEPPHEDGVHWSAVGPGGARCPHVHETRLGALRCVRDHRHTTTPYDRVQREEG